MIGDDVPCPNPRERPHARLLKIKEVAAEVGLTRASIRYYEEIGLLEPVARSEGDYRLYDASDLERLRFIKGLRDDAGFTLAEIGQMLEDEAARAANRARFRETDDPAERRALVAEALARVDRQIGLLEAKIGRLERDDREPPTRGRSRHPQAGSPTSMRGGPGAKSRDDHLTAAAAERAVAGETRDDYRWWASWVSRASGPCSRR